LFALTIQIKTGRVTTLWQCDFVISNIFKRIYVVLTEHVIVKGETVIFATRSGKKDDVLY